MTPMQKQRVQVLRDAYDKNLSEFTGYGSKDFCSFKVLRNDNNDVDDNIVVSINQIAEIDENGYPLTDNMQLLIEPDGNYIPLNQIIPNNQQRIKYFKGLTIIEQ